MTGPGSGDSSDDTEPRDDSRADDDTRGRDSSARSVDRDLTVEDARRDGISETPRETTDGGSESVTVAEDGPITWFLRTENSTVVVVRDVMSSVAVVVLIGLVLFAVSGIWPPMVAVESGSMEPNMQKGDLVFVVEENRFVGDGAVDGTGVVPHDFDGDHEKFGKNGDVIVFRPDGSQYRTPVIHRAHFWVEEGENWVDSEADPDFVNGMGCAQLSSCPAPHAGFVTKGDANSGYDQARAGAKTTIVRPEWVTGKALFRIPLLGHVRLTFDGIFSTLIAGTGPLATDDHGLASGELPSDELTSGGDGAGVSTATSQAPTSQPAQPVTPEPDAADSTDPGGSNSSSGRLAGACLVGTMAVLGRRRYAG